jgi:PHD/YefM family antitoxin component YafN of YafNO toxin-antitoxin module
MDRAIEKISMTQASARGIARMAREAAEGHPVTVARHKRAVAVVLGFDEYQELLSRAESARARPRIPSPLQG